MPGYRENDDCPRGIKIMERPTDNKFESLSMIPEHISMKSIQECMPRVREIEGVFTIGSLGSAGETKESDCDIWVVVDSTQIIHSRMEILREKLDAISRWAWSVHNIEAYFFLLDINDIKENNFGSISQEGAGSSLKSLLKEEFYRTLVLIEGRVPLWCIVPVDKLKSRYDETIRLISDVDSGVDPDDFIDLGDITGIPLDELLAASLWQMHKALSDPMKSVLKMAQIRMYLEEKDTQTLICNVIKKRIHESKVDDFIDPYIETFKVIEHHYLKKSQASTSDFLRKCMYIKASPSISAHDLLMFDRHDKKAFLISIIKQWGWSIKALEMLNAFSKWDIRTYKKFGADIHGFLNSSAAALLKSASSEKDKDVRQDLEIEVLRRRIESVYVKKEDKVESEKRVIKMEAAYEDLYFNFKGGKWQVFNSSDCNEKTGIITSSSRIAAIIAWLVFNRRFGTSTSCHMMPNASNVFLSDVQNLMKELNSIIPDARILGLEREALLKPISIERLVLIGNLEQPSSSGLQEIDVIALNSWKELYCMRMENSEVRAWFSHAGSKQTKICVWTPGGSDSRSLALELISLVRIR